MKLICLEPHVYQDQRFEPGQVYELDDHLATEFLRDFGPANSSEVRRGRAAKFAAAPVPVETDEPAAEEPEELVEPDAPVVPAGPTGADGTVEAPAPAKKARTPRSKK